MSWTRWSRKFAAEPVGTEVPERYLDWLPRALPRGWTADAAHLRLIGEHLDRMTRREIDRLIIEMPPRHGKTETCTVRYPIYRIERSPETRVLVATHTQAFSNKLGRKSRNVARERVALSGERSAMEEFETTAGGGMMLKGIGSPPTGSGFDLIIGDDWIKTRQQAESAIYRDRIWDSWTDDFLTRLEPGGQVIMIMTRWHEDDPVGRILGSAEARDWVRVRLPALAEAGDPLGRGEGEPLWPERYDRASLARIRRTMTKSDGLRSWESLYQQNPTPREGNFFKVSRLGVAEQVPGGVEAFVRRWGACRAWDLAATEGGGDHTAGVLMAGPDEDGRFWVLDVVRGRWDTDERNRIMRRTAEGDGRLVRVRLPQDPGAAGVEASKAHVRMLAGFPVRVRRVTGDKSLRADPLSSQVNAGNVVLARGGWNAAFLEEFRQFPGGAHDDQVDAASDAFGELGSWVRSSYGVA